LDGEDVAHRPANGLLLLALRLLRLRLALSRCRNLVRRKGLPGLLRRLWRLNPSMLLRRLALRLRLVCERYSAELSLHRGHGLLRLLELPTANGGPVLHCTGHTASSVGRIGRVRHEPLHHPA
jgi:hypothetical protein